MRNHTDVSIGQYVNTCNVAGETALHAASSRAAAGNDAADSAPQLVHTLQQAGADVSK